ncbi:hypothetical protein CDAR_594681 [Caerostris darwini]|uniref:Uncharacterized protein n=1 Tax=Caerostris darwini TaxID=1538125 RepID=A0AAV4WVF6_9ARAC|nr:hypothetical protein CDAR_594681 [Caerostris darwini]
MTQTHSTKCIISTIPILDQHSDPLKPINLPSAIGTTSTSQHVDPPLSILIRIDGAATRKRRKLVYDAHIFSRSLNNVQLLFEGNSVNCFFEGVRFLWDFSDRQEVCCVCNSRTLAYFRTF